MADFLSQFLKPLATCEGPLSEALEVSVEMDEDLPSSMTLGVLDDMLGIGRWGGGMRMRMGVLYVVCVYVVCMWCVYCMTRQVCALHTHCTHCCEHIVNTL